MEENKSLEVFAKAPIRKAVLQNALPAMAAMLMVLVYNLADTFFIGQTHDDLQVAAVSLATPVFLLFMSVGTVFGIGGTSVISRALGEGRNDYAKKVCSFCMWSCVGVGILMSALFLLFMDPILSLIGASAETWAYAKNYLTIVSCSGPFVLIANCYSNIIRAEGQSGKAMMGQLLAARSAALRVAFADFSASPWQGFEKSERGPNNSSLFQPLAAVVAVAVQVLLSAGKRAASR